MSTKTIVWNTGTGNITLTYQGQGNGTIVVESDANNLGTSRSQTITVETVGGAITKNLTISQTACPIPVGTVLSYSYTGSYQEVTLPAGQYKLQCWGAQGGSNAAASSYGITAMSGGKGGYSEGVLTLSSQTILRIFVGGQGSSSGNGGFNCGGGSSGSSTYSTYNYTSGKCYTTSGSLVSDSDWGVCTDYIPCSPGDDIFWLFDSPNTAGVSGNHCIMCYNSSKSVVDYWQAIDQAGYPGARHFTAPSNTYYLRPSFRLNKGAKLFINNVLAWEPCYVVGRSRMGCGGGATDIALVSSTMSYVSNRNDRSEASLLSRMIVAGGGGGGAMVSLINEPFTTYYWAKSGKYDDSTITRTITSDGFVASKTSASEGTNVVMSLNSARFPATVTFNYSYTGSGTIPVYDATNNKLEVWGSTVTNANIRANISNGSGTITVTMSDANRPHLGIYCNDLTNGATLTVTDTVATYSVSPNTTTSSQVGYVGGGTNGGGYSSTYYGKQNGAGTNGAFGKGANQTVTNYKFASGAGGAGWYGGGGGVHSDSDINYCKYSGGGSGFVNIAANAGYRPSGYTGLELDSGETKAGNQSFPNTEGTGNETGHAGNGYAKITRLE